jgi:hypothetical protein
MEMYAKQPLTISLVLPTQLIHSFIKMIEYALFTYNLARSHILKYNWPVSCIAPIIVFLL